MYNRVGIMGRFAQDPVLRQMPSGAVMVTFTLAVERDYRDQSGERGTDFIDCVAWRKTAEFVSKYFTKGRAALVDGRLQVRHWADESGNKRRAMEVLVEDVHFVDSPRERGSSAAGMQRATSVNYQPSTVDADGFIPLPDNEPLPY